VPVLDNPSVPPIVLSDELSKYIARDTATLEQFGWSHLVNSRRGKSDITPGIEHLPHPAARLLRHLQKQGASVTLKSDHWDEALIESTIARGPHKSAHEYAEFLREEMTDFVKKGYWIVLPYKALRNQRKQFKLLRVNPMGVVPQRARRPRLIVDYSFLDLNRDTVKLAPQEAMQFGHALHRILHSIVDSDPQYGPVKLIKVDIADGFYRIWLNLDHIPKLAVAIPSLKGEEPLLALPLVLPMGWTESPPYFCTATETVTDVANARAMQGWNPPAHRLDHEADSPPEPEPIAPLPDHPSLPSLSLPPQIPATLHNRRKLGAFDVFVDDFIGLAQGSPQRLNRLRRILFHTLDDVLRPLDSTDDEHRKEPASVKKLRQGDACWATRKLILGWLIDTVAMTLELPAHRKARLQELLAEIPRTQKRLSVRKWQQIIGELRSMSIAIPGSRGMFSLLQEALRHQSDKRIRLSRGVHDCLDDLRWLTADLASRPTRLYELVPQHTSETLGAVDASGLGMGGVWFPSINSRSRQRPQSRACDDSTSAPTRSNPLPPGASPLHPILWRARFPADITKDLVSSKNPSGTITNSDLELAGTITHNDVAAHSFDIRERTISSGSDNTPAVAWQRKGSTTTTAAPAYLLRLQALHQRFHRYLSSNFYLPGVLNTMADDCSRLWHYSDADLLTYFDSHYPQTLSWQLVQPRSEMLSSVTSALRRHRPEPASFLQEPPPTTALGASGPSSVETFRSIPGLTPSPTLSSCSKSLPIGTAPDPLRPVVTPSDLALWKAPSERWVRRSPAWGPRTHG
jgi:hypothetical protein